jgi:hypothetical protein
MEARVLGRLRQVVEERRQRVRRRVGTIGMLVGMLALMVALVPSRWLEPLGPRESIREGMEMMSGRNDQRDGLRREFAKLRDEREVKILAAGRLIAGDRAAFEVMMGLLDEVELPLVQRKGIEAALIVPGRFTLDLMLEHLRRYPQRRSAVVVARLLEEVAMIECTQGLVPDPRIVPALFQVMNAHLGDRGARLAEPMRNLAEMVSLCGAIPQGEHEHWR